MLACLDQASTIAGLIHPNIVRLLDFGVQEGKLFLVLEFIAGNTLQQNYPPGSHPSPAFIISLVKQIADTVQYAHKQNIVHGNLKPENILLDPDHVVLLNDFGIATILQTMGTQQRQSGLGDSSYTAPEQFDDMTQPASDQYALAIMADEWLNGGYQSQDATIVSSQQSWDTQTASISGSWPTINDVLNRATKEDPSQRFGSMQEFATVLEQAYNRDTSARAFPTNAPPTYPSEPAPIPLYTEQETQIFRQEQQEPPAMAWPLSVPSHLQQKKYNIALIAILIILTLIVVNALIFVGPNRLLSIINRNGVNSQPTPVIPTAQALIPTLAQPTPTIQPTPTPTVQPTTTPEQQAQAVIDSYFTAINNKDYQTAYNLWVNYPDSYQNFANGFADTQHDNDQLGTTFAQSDGTIQVPLTLIAISTSGQQTTYQGYYILGLQPDGTWKIVTASIEQQA
jgi:serine/threonine protein kinase